MSETVPSFVELSVKSSLKKPRYTANERQVHCDNWRNSGLSMSEYCRRSGLAISSLSAWVKRQNSVPEPDSKMTSEKVSIPRRQGMEIILVSGIKLRFVEIGNIGEILRLLKALESCG
jgi:hypothetical protein